ncbi:MAG: DUF2500 family protein [Eubacteriales bacterium]
MNWDIIVQYSVITIIGITLISCLIYKYIRDYTGKDISEYAELIDKSVTEYDIQGKYNSYQKNVYVLVFNAGGKILKFMVGQFAYDSVKKGSRGMLTYHGERMINFHIKKNSNIKNKKFTKPK